MSGTAQAVAEAARGLVRAQGAFPGVNWIDAVSQGQLRSKLWLTDLMADLDPHYGTAWVMGGWVGMLPLLLLSAHPERFDRIVTIDIDEEACRAADMLLRAHVQDGLRFAAIPGDAMTVDYRAPSLTRVTAEGERHAFRIACRTVINTSWEHFEDPEAWLALIPKDKLVVIQANTNPDAEGHVSCPTGLDELCARTPFARRLMADALPFGAHARLMTAGFT